LKPHIMIEEATSAVKSVDAIREDAVAKGLMGSILSV
jgi:hypothetical protein